MKIEPRLITTLRWIARTWGLLAFLAVVLAAIGPDLKTARQPAELVDWMLLSLYPLAALGLLWAWRWEASGGLLAVLCMLIEIFGFRLAKGMWYPNLVGFAVPLLLFALPGLMFIIVSSLSRRRQRPAEG